MYGSPFASLDILSVGIRLLRDGVGDELAGLGLVARVSAGERPQEEEVRPHQGRRPRRRAAPPTQGKTCQKMLILFSLLDCDFTLRHF